MYMTEQEIRCMIVTKLLDKFPAQTDIQTLLNQAERVTKWICNGLPQQKETFACCE